MAAGRGSRLPELTGDRPKCLLPIGPFPLIWFPLHMLQKHGFQGELSVALILAKSQQHNLFLFTISLRRGYHCCAGTSEIWDPASSRENASKVEARLCLYTVVVGFGYCRIIETYLWQVRTTVYNVHSKPKNFLFYYFRIKADLLVVSCDTITNVDLFPLLNTFRQHDASLSVLFLKGGAEANTVVPGPKNKHKPGLSVIMKLSINFIIRFQWIIRTWFDRNTWGNTAATVSGVD